MDSKSTTPTANIILKEVFNDLPCNAEFRLSRKYILDPMKRYAILKCEQQRELCANTVYGRNDTALEEGILKASPPDFN